MFQRLMYLLTHRLARALLRVLSLLVTVGLLLLGLLSLLTGVTSVEGLTKLHLSLHLSLLLLHAELVAGLLNGKWVLKVSTLLLSILNINQVEGLLSDSLDLSVAINS